MKGHSLETRKVRVWYVTPKPWASELQRMQSAFKRQGGRQASQKTETLQDRDSLFPLCVPIPLAGWLESGEEPAGNPLFPTIITGRPKTKQNHEKDWKKKKTKSRPTNGTMSNDTRGVFIDKWIIPEPDKQINLFTGEAFISYVYKSDILTHERSHHLVYGYIWYPLPFPTFKT